MIFKQGIQNFGSRNLLCDIQMLLHFWGVFISQYRYAYLMTGKAGTDYDPREFVPKKFMNTRNMAIFGDYAIMEPDQTYRGMT